MSEWPDVDELKKLLDVGDETDFDAHIDSLLAAAIARVKGDVGRWQPEDEPTEALRQAALRAAMLMRANSDNTDEALAKDPIYQYWMTGKRRRFHIG